METTELKQILKIIGKRLKTKRLEQNLSKKKLAKKIGIKKKYLIKIEKGTAKGVTVLQIFNICIALKFNPLKLFENL